MPRPGPAAAGRLLHVYSPPLVQGTLLRRYQRFLVDVRLRRGGEVVTAHTPNTGRMVGCSAPGSPVYLSRADDPRRRLAYTLELVRAGGTLVGVNPLLPNRLLALAVARGLVPRLGGYARVRREVRAGHSRIDLLLEGDGAPCYVEIKNVTLVQGGVARFPDAVTSRGVRHLQELTRLAAAGARAVMLFAVQRADAAGVGPADAFDPAYGLALRRAVGAGVEAMALQLRVSPRQVCLGAELPVTLDGWGGAGQPPVRACPRTPAPRRPPGSRTPRGRS